MPETKKDLNFRKTANTKQGNFQPARKDTKVSGGVIKPAKKGK
jgi:hypothetical protein